MATILLKNGVRFLGKKTSPASALIIHNYTIVDASFTDNKRAALHSHMRRPKLTCPEPGSYIINPSPAAADPDHHNNTVKYLLERVYGDTAAAKALHFSDNELYKDGLIPMDRFVDSPYFEKTNSIGGGAGLWVHLQTPEGSPFLWDPSTNDVLFLHHRHVPPGTPFLVSSCFGYDSASQDFKLIRFMNYGGDAPETAYKQALLYSMKLHSWKDITIPATFNVFNCNICFTPAYVNGVAYWAGKYSILSFDFGKMCFNVLSLPKGVNEETHSCKVVDIEGMLGLIVFEETGKNKCFKLWVGGESSSKWVRVRNWSVDVCGAEMPLGLSKDGRILFLQGVDHELLEYDLAAREVKKTGIYGFLWKMALLPYVENASMTLVHDDGISAVTKAKAKMRVIEGGDFLFASARKWKIGYGDGDKRGVFTWESMS